MTDDEVQVDELIVTRSASGRIYLETERFIIDFTKVTALTAGFALLEAAGWFDVHPIENA